MIRSMLALLVLGLVLSFVAPSGAGDDALLASTFLGGDGSDNAISLVSADDGSIYIAGGTYSGDFPVTAGAYDTTFNGERDIFVAKMTGDCSDIIWATFVGGTGDEQAHGIALGPGGDLYVTGWTDSVDWPTTDGAYDTAHNGDADVYVFRILPDGSGLVYSTYVGGSQYDSALAGIAVGDDGTAYVSGHTNSPDFPTTANAYDRTYFAAGWDAIAFRLNDDGSDLMYSTYIGGWDYEGGRSIAVDGAGRATIAGDTTSQDFPTTNGAFDTTHNGGRDCFLTQFNADGSDLVYSTFIGSSDDDIPNDLAQLEDGSIWLTGYTFGDDYPTSPDAYSNSVAGERDVFITLMNADASDLDHSTLIGGAGTDEGLCIVPDDRSTVYLGARTNSDDFPTTNDSYDSDPNGAIDSLFIAFDVDEQLVYSTYIGSSENDALWEIARNGGGLVLVGLTAGDDHPATAGCHDDTYNGGHVDAVVVRFAAVAGNAPPFLTISSPVNGTTVSGIVTRRGFHRRGRVGGGRRDRPLVI